MRKLILAIVLLTGCGQSFKPASYVDKLRVLAIRADSPELAPKARGEDGAILDPQPEGQPPSSTTLRSLVADPKQLSDDARTATVVYLACTPDPLDPYDSVCTSLEQIASPEGLKQLLAGGAATTCGEGAPAQPGQPGGGVDIRFLGLEQCDQVTGCAAPLVDLGAGPTQLPPPTYEIPDTFTLDALPAGHPARVKGVQVVVLAVALVASPDELFDGADPSDPCAFATKVSGRLGELLDSRESVTALKRIQVRGPDLKDELNVNPAIPGLSADGTDLPAPLPDEIPANATFRPGQESKLLPLVPVGDDVYQPFTRYDAEGAVIREEKESWLWTWFATAGTFADERTRAADEKQIWTAPTGRKDEAGLQDPIPASNRVFLYAVVRDARGGIDWAVREVRIDR